MRRIDNVRSLKYLAAELGLLLLSWLFQCIFWLWIVFKLQYEVVLCTIIYVAFLVLFCALSYIVGKRITCKGENEKKAILLIFIAPLVFLAVSGLLQLFTHNRDILVKVIAVFIMPIQYLAGGDTFKRLFLEGYLLPLLSVGLPQVLMIIGMHRKLREVQ